MSLKSNLERTIEAEISKLNEEISEWDRQVKIAQEKRQEIVNQRNLLVSIRDRAEAESGQ